MKVAHRTGEHVRVKDLERCERILGQVIEKLCCKAVDRRTSNVDSNRNTNAFRPSNR
jgi:hypothetical protein